MTDFYTLLMDVLFLYVYSNRLLRRASLSLSNQTPSLSNQTLSLSNQTPSLSNQTLSLSNQTLSLSNQTPSLSMQHSPSALCLLTGFSNGVFPPSSSYNSVTTSSTRNLSSNRNNTHHLPTKCSTSTTTRLDTSETRRRAPFDNLSRASAEPGKHATNTVDPKWIAEDYISELHP